MCQQRTGGDSGRIILSPLHPLVLLRLLHLAAVLMLALVTVPLRLQGRSPSRHRVRRDLAAAVLRSLGVRLVIEGRAPKASLLAANHVSWLDILLVVTLSDATFVAKREVAAWPFIGWLAQRTDTIFLKRHCARSAFVAKQRIAAELAAERSVLVFAEGTTTEGDDVLPFRSALLQGAIDGGRPVVPVRIAYRSLDRRCEAAAFVGDTPLWRSIFDVARVPSLVAHVGFLDPLRAGPSHPPGASRKRLAWLAREAVRTSLRTLHADTKLQPGVQESVRVPR